MENQSRGREVLTVSHGGMHSPTNQTEFELDVLGTMWTVKVGELYCQMGGGKQFGFMNAEERTITINQETHPSWRLYLLLHEVLHALTFLGHLQFLRLEGNPHQDDESKVDAIASLLAAVLIRNNLSNTAALNTQPSEVAESIREPARRERKSGENRAGTYAVAAKSPA